MPAFGLDIGSHSIKAVELSRAGEKYNLVAAGITSTPHPGMTSEAEGDLGKIAEAIKKLLTDTKITTRQVNLTLPESQVFTRLIDLPPLTDQEVSSAIAWQAEPYIPIPIAEASIDYQIVARREPQGPNKPGGVQVLLVAAPKALIDKYVRVAGLSGLTVTSIETELLVLTRALAPPEGASLIVDLGATSTDIAVVYNGRLMVSRSIATAGEALTRSLMTGLSLGRDQAENYKKSYGLTEELEGRVKQALEPATKIIAEEMKKAARYWTDELKGEQVRSAILSGGTAGLPELVPYLANLLGMEVSIADPFAKVTRDERLNKEFSAYALLYAIALGAALE